MFSSRHLMGCCKTMLCSGDCIWVYLRRSLMGGASHFLESWHAGVFIWIYIPSLNRGTFHLSSSESVFWRVEARSVLSVWRSCLIVKRWCHRYWDHSTCRFQIGILLESAWNITSKESLQWFNRNGGSRKKSVVPNDIQLVSAGSYFQNDIWIVHKRLAWG